jgi:gluconokinase
MLSYDSPLPANQGSKDSHAPSLSVPVNGTFDMSSTTASLQSNAPKSQQYKHHHIWLVTGPAGCGKTTIAEHLANSLSLPYIEGDAFHTKTNVEKMRNGVPLTDADRWDWLTALREESLRLLNSEAEGVVLTCSALKRKYRDVIRVAAYYDPSVLIHFIYLDASEEVLTRRVTARQGHYMGANMVQSQFSILEPPSQDEKDIISIDVSRTADEVKVDALDRVRQVMNNDRNDENHN